MGMYSFGVTLAMLIYGGVAVRHGKEQWSRKVPDDLHQQVLRYREEGDEAASLLCELLERDPGQRPAAAAAKHNPWFYGQLGHTVDELLPLSPSIPEDAEGGVREASVAGLDGSPLPSSSASGSRSTVSGSA